MTHADWITPAECARMRARQRDGALTGAIARDFDCSRNTVQRHCNGHCSHDGWTESVPLDTCPVCGDAVENLGCHLRRECEHVGTGGKTA